MSTFTKRIRRHPRCINRHFSTTIFALCCLIFGEALQGRDLFAGRRISCSKPPSALSSTRSSRAINNELKIGSNNEHRPTTLETKTTQAVSKSRRTSERQRFSQKLLTMEEEQALGRKIRKAAEVKELMASVIEDKHSKQFEKTVSEGGFIEDEEGNFDSLTQLSIYSIDAEEKMKSNPSAPDMLAAVSDDPTMHVVLTESDIRDRLRIPGGRKELNKILIGGAMAREKLISSNIGLVMSIARKWCRQSAAFSGEQAMSSVYKGGWTRPSLDEAVQEGIIGLATAADRYDHERKLKFGTYATYWITNSVRNCFQRASTGCLRVPSNYHLIRQRYQQIVKVHYIESGGKPKSIDSAAAELGLTTKRLEYILKKTESLISIDAPPPKLAIQAQAGKAGADEESENYCLGNSLSWYV